MLGLCNGRLAAAPGIEFYLAPVIYLWVLRAFGLKAGAIAAVVTTAPSVGWWGHGYIVLFSLLQVLFIAALLRARRGRLATVDAVFLFAIGVMLPVGALLLFGLYSPPPWAVELILISTISNNLMAAAFVDGFTANVVVERGSLRLVVRRSVRLGVWLRSVVHAVLALVHLAGALLAGREFWTHIADQRALDRAEIYALLQSSPPVFRGERRHVTLTRAHPDGPIEAIFGGPDVDLDAGSPAARALGCERVVRQSSAPSPIREIHRFEDLLARCELTRLRTADGAVQVLMPLRPAATRVFRRAVLYLGVGSGVMVLLSILVLLFQRTLDRTLGRWNVIIEGLGAGGLMAAPVSRFRELSEPAQRIVEANNRYVAALRQADAARDAVIQLHARLGLRAVRNIVIDPGGEWIEFDEPSAPAPGRLRVPAQMTRQVDAPRNRRDVIVEAYLGDAPGQGWHRVLLGERLAGGDYVEGLMEPMQEPSTTLNLLAHRQRLVRLGQNVAMVAHELRQPLFIARLVAERMRYRMEGIPGEASARLAIDVEQLEQSLERTQDIVMQLNRTARLGARDEGGCEPGPVIAQLLRAKESSAIQQRTRLTFDSRLPPGLRIGASDTTLSQIVGNLVDNALDAIRDRQSRLRPGPGEVHLRLDVTRSGAVRLICRDDGGGLPPALQGAKIFKSFVTTKRRGKGTGLGLYVVQRLVRHQGGEITFENRPGAGVTFQVLLPAEAVPRDRTRGDGPEDERPPSE